MERVGEDEQDEAPSRSSFAAIALAAAAVMLFQIALTRLFSFITWHHLGFMVISVALLGFAVSGAALQAWPRLGRRGAAPPAAVTAACMLLVLPCLGQLSFDPTRLEEPRQLAQLVLVYAVLVAPFGAAGLTIVLLLRQGRAGVGALYASDLLGAGAGSLAAVGLLPRVGAGGLVCVAAALSLLAAGLLTWGRPRWRWAALGGVACMLAVGPQLADRQELRPVASKALVAMLDPQRFPLARIATSGWNSLARVDVVEGTGPVSWSLSPVTSAPPPAPQSLIVIDGDAATPVIQRQGRPGELAFLDYTLSSAAAQAFDAHHALVIGSGGGIDVLTALRHGVQQVDAVEVNPLIADLVGQGRYARLGGELFQDPRVRLHVEDGRSFARRSAERYDLIQLSLIDTWAASMSGAYSLSEGYLYTTEAFSDYLEHLTPGGVVSMTRWLGTPPRESLRVSAVAARALESLGVSDPGACVVVLQLGRMANTLVKRTAFTPAELERLRQVSGARGFRFVHLPGARVDNDISRFFNAPDRDAYLAGYPAQVDPTTDDAPFFFQFARWSELLQIRQAWASSTHSGRLLLLIVLAQAGLLSVGLLAAPRWRRREPARFPWAVVAYFAGIGLGFMLLEVSLMQRYTLYLGNPTYAFALVLATLLVGAGIGSALQPRLESRTRLVFAALVGAIALHALAVPALLDGLLWLSAGGRVALSVVTLLPLGLLLGVPFPLALSRLARDPSESVVGWAWAANGCASVIGPVLAVLLAIDLGFTWVQLGAALIYGLVLKVLPGVD